MTESSDTFRTVLRGYDPTEVDRKLAELGAAVTALTQQRDGLSARVQELMDAASSPAEAPGYEHLGARVGQILELAHSEASELRSGAQEEADAHRAKAHDEAGQVREEADRYAARTHSDAESQAARIVEEARKAADEHRDSAERDASVRLQEAEAVYEEQRARAAKAAADFETTLAGRRRAAEEEFTHQMAESQARLDEATQLADRTRTEAEDARAQATKEAARLVEDARGEAAQIVSEAKATAERIRADSERELTAASQRRDSINAQLSNVRQMLATLTGTASMPFGLASDDDTDDEAAAGPAGETATADPVTGDEQSEGSDDETDGVRTDAAEVETEQPEAAEHEREADVEQPAAHGHG